MGRARAQISVPGPISEAERLWYDLDRWPGFIDGFRHLAKREGEWPREGARLIWDSVPDGRGRVLERVVAYEVRTGQTVEVEDPQMKGTQSIAFSAGEDGMCKVALTLDYKLKTGGPFAPVVDALFVGRAVRDALRRTLSRFARELRADRDFGV